MSEIRAITNGNGAGSQEPKPDKPIRIVIADDHPIFREGLKYLLGTQEDFQLLAEVGNGDDVLDTIEKLQPDILLLDLRMPGTHGLVVLERLQATKISSTKVIVLTASEDKNEFVQAMKLGTSGIVLKQSAPELIVKSIRKVHSGEIWLDSHTTAAVMRQFASPAEVMSGVPGNGRERSPLSQRE